MNVGIIDISERFKVEKNKIKLKFNPGTQLCTYKNNNYDVFFITFFKVIHIKYINIITNAFLLLVPKNFRPSSET